MLFHSFDSSSQKLADLYKVEVICCCLANGISEIHASPVTPWDYIKDYLAQNH